MECPNCHGNNVDVYEARGYTSKQCPIIECECGQVWRLVPLDENRTRVDTIKLGRRATPAVTVRGKYFCMIPG